MTRPRRSQLLRELDLERFKRPPSSSSHRIRCAPPPPVSPAQALLNRVEMAKAFGLDFTSAVFPHRQSRKAHQEAVVAYQAARDAVFVENQKASEGT